jgi:hypothetical protein
VQTMTERNPFQIDDIIVARTTKRNISDNDRPITIYPAGCSPLEREQDERKKDTR